MIILTFIPGMSVRLLKDKTYLVRHQETTETHGWTQLLRDVEMHSMSAEKALR